MLLRQERILDNIKPRSLFEYVQCDIEVPENPREPFANFPPALKNINVGTDDVGPFMKAYAEVEEQLTQSRRSLKSSPFLVNGTIFQQLLLFYLDLGLVCKKNCPFVQYTPVKCFNDFVPTSVIGKTEGDENPNSSVSAEFMKLLAKRSHVYQNMDRS